MRFRVIPLLLLLVIAPSWASAQDTTPAAPWPPDPQAIFAEGVEVVKTELIAPQIDTGPKIDNTARIVHIYDKTTEAWHIYPYPSELEIIDTITKRSDGTFLLNPYDLDIKNIWEFDPTSNQFLRPEMVCGNQIKALPGEGKWVPYTEPQVKKKSLCFTETDEIANFILPHSVSAALGYFNSPDLVISPSPDGKWLALLGFAGDYPPKDAIVYSYEVATGNFNVLGQIEGLRDDTYIENWVGNTHVVVFNGDMPEIWPKDRYAANVTQPNSLMYVVPGLADYYDDPPRYEFVTTTAYSEWKFGSEVVPHQPCALTLYEPDTVGLKTYPLGYDCAYRQLVRVKNGYFFVRVFENATDTSELSYLDIQTGGIEPLVNGSLLYPASASSDGRYVVLVMYADKHILKDYFSDFINWLNYPKAYIAIFDTVERKFVYQSPVFLSPDLDPVRDWSGCWCGNECILLAFYREGMSSLSRIMLTETGFQESTVADVIEVTPLSPNKREMVVRSGNSSVFSTSRNLSLLDFSTQKITPIIREETIALYDYQFEWDENSDVIVIVSLKEGGIYAPSVRYILRL